MIYIVRHGQTDWNLEHRTQGQSDIPLNDIGRGQAADLANRIADLKIDTIFASDLSRAYETAAILNKNRCVPIKADQRLREFNYGDLEGTPGLTRSPQTWDIYNKTPEQFNAEPMNAVFERIKSFFDTLNFHQNILIVTHGGAIRMMMYYVENPTRFDDAKFTESYKFKKITNAEIFQWSGEFSTSIKNYEWEIS